MTTAKKLAILVLVLITGLVIRFRTDPPPDRRPPDDRAERSSKQVEPAKRPPREEAAADGNAAISEAFANQRSSVQVQGSGQVSKLLADDDKGSRHQRFVVRLPSGQTVLIAHNIDLASRVASLERGDEVQFEGEYEWSAAGGVIHWTHRDPAGRHRGGWIRHEGKTYD